MAKIIELIDIMRGSGACQQGREVSAAALSDAIERWRQSASLMAYQVILSALDSNDEEIRATAERLLNRSSPRPANHRANSNGANLDRDPRWKESA
jgi:hypothetical protein